MAFNKPPRGGDDFDDDNDDDFNQDPDYNDDDDDSDSDNSKSPPSRPTSGGLFSSQDRPGSKPAPSSSNFGRNNDPPPRPGSAFGGANNPGGSNPGGNNAPRPGGSPFNSGSSSFGNRPNTPPSDAPKPLGSGSGSGSTPGGSNPPRPGGSPFNSGSSSFGNRPNTPSSDAPKPLGSGSGSGSTPGGNNPPRPGGSPFSSGSSSFGNRPNTPPSGSGSGSSGGTPGSNAPRPGGSPFSSGSSSFGNRPSTPASGPGSGSSGSSGGGSGNTPGSNLPGGSNAPRPNNPLGAFGRPSTPSGGAKPPDNKPSGSGSGGNPPPSTSAPRSPLGGVFGNRGAADKPGDKLADKPKVDDKKSDANAPAPNRLGGVFGGFGRKAEDAPKNEPLKDASKDAPRSSPLSGLGARFGGGGGQPQTPASGSGSPSGSNAPANKPPLPGSSSSGFSSKPSGSGFGSSGSSSGIGSSGSGTAGSGFGNKSSGSSSPFGSALNKPSGSSSSGSSAAKPGDKKDDKPAGGGNPLSRITARLPFGRKAADSATSSTSSASRPGDSRAAISSAPGKKIPAARGDKQARPLDRKPKSVVVTRSFSQDHQLDLAGIGLVVLGIIIFFGVISPNPNDGAITGGIVKLLGQLFGYGRYVWPLPCVAVGGWLILRHFRDEPPILEYHRLIGWGLLLLVLMTTLQFLELLQKPVPTLTALEKISTEAWQVYGRGGGWVGDKLYMLIESATNDYAAPAVLIGWWIIALMLALGITLSELTSYVRSIAQFFSRAHGGYQDRRQQAMAAAALAADANPPLTVETPGKTPAPGLTGGGRKGIPATTEQAQPALALVGATAAASTAANSPARGLFSRTNSSPAPTNAVPVNMTATSAVADPVVAAPVTDKPAGRIGLFGGRSAAPPPPLDNAPLQPSRNPFAPAAVENASATNGNPSTVLTDKPVDKSVSTPASTNDTSSVAPRSPLSGLFSRGSAPAPVAGTISSSAGDDNKPAAPRSPLSGGLFGSRSAPPAPVASTSATGTVSTPVKTDDASAASTPNTASDDNKPAASRSPLSGGLFGSRSAPPAPIASTSATGAVSTPVKTDDVSTTTSTPNTVSDDNKPAAPRSPLSGGLFGSRSAPPAPTASTSTTSSPSTPVKSDDVSTTTSTPNTASDDNKPAAPRSPLSGGLFGSRSAPPTPATSTPAKSDDVSTASTLNTASDDNKPAAPRSPLSGSLFGSRSAPPAPAASTSAKTDDVSDPASTKSDPVTNIDDNKPIAPAASTSAVSSAPTANAASDDNKPALPRSPLAGSAFGARTIPPTPAVNQPINPMTRPVVKAALPLDEDDDDLVDDGEPKYVPLDEDSEPIPTPNRPQTPSSTAMGARPSPYSSTPRPLTPSTATHATGSTVNPSVPSASPAGPPVRTSTPLIRQPGQPATSSASNTTASPSVSDTDSKPLTPTAPVVPTVDGIIVRSKGGSAWELPNYQELLEKGSQRQIDNEYLMERARVIEDTLQSFGAPGNIVEINSGPVITQFGVEPDFLVSRQGKKTRVKVSSIAKLDADLALALAARSIRIEAPVPGKGYVGIEVPNAKTTLVGLRDIMDSEPFAHLKSKLRIGLGQSVDGTPVAVDLTSMPHLLIAGTTGSGKSVCVNAIIVSLLLENSPDDVKFIMVDPKRVELTGYNGIPHLVAPVVVDLERIVGVLKWVTREMDERYKKFSQIGARHLIDYNARLTAGTAKLPYLVVVIDELADLMMLAPDETEKVLTRLAQMARATGIHLIVSTQRPSVDVVTGLIKANFPARISFAVASSVDSRVILDSPGAEKLLGRGDMLYQAPDAAAPVRMQGVYVSDNEINRITRYWKTARLPNASAANSESAQPAKSVFDMPEAVQSRSEKYSGSSGSSSNLSKPAGNGTVPGTFPASPTSSSSNYSPPSSTPKPTNGESDEDEEMYHEAAELVKRMNNKVSVSLLQRKLRIGYMRAARLIELMKQRGLIDATNIADGKALEDEA